jgi:putrescine aminotransferase
MTIKPLETAQWQELDRAHYLHPFTDHAGLRQQPARVVTRAEGVYFWDTDGNRILDGLSGLGNVNIGYGRPELAEAAAAQMRELSFCQSFFRTTHPSAISLAVELSALAPGGHLNHVFFQTSGSEANETAVRAVRKYWELAGQPEKRTIISRDNAYHGSTALAASLSGLLPMHRAGGDLPLPGIRHIKAPYSYLHGAGLSPDEFGIVAARWLEQAILDAGPERVAAFWAEPVQSAGGAIVPPPGYWSEIQRICRKYDVLLAIDEVVCGFGRTGAWFGSDTYAIVPDIMQLGKGITSGYAPLSATLLSDRIADVLIERGGEWAHGFTYSGHPTCCAVALANIRILREEGIVERVGRETAPLFKAAIESFADHPLIGDARCVGLIGGLQIVRNKTTREVFPSEQQIGEYCSAEALKRGLALRANGDTMTLMPPLIITPAQLEFVFGVAREALDATAHAYGMAA